MKIADFGLCRDVHLKGYYRKTTDVSIPLYGLLEALKGP